MIEIRNLTKSFSGTPVLRGVSLNVRAGTTRVILGLSGSGKSVLMKHMIGLMKPDSGSIMVDGVDLTAMNGNGLLEIRRKFGMVFQQSALFDSMTVWENVAFPLVEHTKLSKPEVNDRVMDKLKLVGLEAAVDKFPAELSGGMRKRVGLARAVILEPKCVLYDEPTTGLDPVTTDNVDQMILDAAERLKVTSVVISHDIGSALKVADDIAVLHKGEIVEDCTPEELKRSQHPFVREFLDIWFGKQ
jgi:phospholipid/cholesterol/gamma-HCH transport system ATP-binding protein